MNPFVTDAASVVAYPTPYAGTCFGQRLEPHLKKEEWLWKAASSTAFVLWNEGIQKRLTQSSKVDLRERSSRRLVRSTKARGGALARLFATEPREVKDEPKTNASSRFELPYSLFMCVDSEESQSLVNKTTRLQNDFIAAVERTMRHERYLERISDLRDPMISKATMRSGMKIWLKILCEAAIDIPVPGSSAGEGGALYYTWNRKGFRLIAEIQDNEPVAWLFRNLTTKDEWLNEVPVDEKLPSKLIEHLYIFSKLKVPMGEVLEELSLDGVPDIPVSGTIEGT